MPNVFRTMTGGGIFGAVWFLLLFFAGITSAIAMYNYLVALLEEDAGINRKKRCLDSILWIYNSRSSCCVRANTNKNSRVNILYRS